MSAVLSPCRRYRYRLERALEPGLLVDHGDANKHDLRGKTVGFFGVNPATADAAVDDATVRKWTGFCRRWGVPRFIVGNAFAYRATDVRELATVEDPHGPDIGDHVSAIMEDADILVPCWGDTGKVPMQLREYFDVLLDALTSCGKPVMHFGLTKGGDFKHPLMLPYSTPLVLLEDESHG